MTTGRTKFPETPQGVRNESREKSGRRKLIKRICPLFVLSLVLVYLCHLPLAIINQIDFSEADPADPFHLDLAVDGSDVSKVNNEDLPSTTTSDYARNMEKETTNRGLPLANNEDMHSTMASNENLQLVLNRFIERESTSPSLRILLESLKTHSPSHAYGEPITKDMEEEETKRCQRFGFNFDPERKFRRRIFYGSNIADDSWHPIAVHAAEAYGLYHTVAYIESNTTTSESKSKMKSRKLRFVTTETGDSNSIENNNKDGDNSDDDPSLNLQVLQSGIFGPRTKVTVDLYIDNPKDRTGDNGRESLIHESMQREQALKRWKMNGMTEDDIAVFSDVDEVYSRDFLLAATTCDVPQFRKGQDCREPKILGTSLIFESSAECITKARWWHHPDMIIGECVDMIGNSTLHLPGEREFLGNGRQYGKRITGYGKGRASDNSIDYTLYKPNHDSEGRPMFPLWKPVDFRSTEGGTMLADKRRKQTSFHFRNFFPSIKVLRKKFNSYTHADPLLDHETIPLGFNVDMITMINCALGRKDAKDAKNKRLEGGFDAIDGDTPILFQNNEYRKARHEELRDAILEDEAKYGSNAPIQPVQKQTEQEEHMSKTKSTGGTDATVIGMATRYALPVFKQFVGSLRKTGYEGHIILGVSPKEKTESNDDVIKDGVMKYLLSQNVTMKHIEYVPCEYELGTEGCAHPYPNIKNRWSRFPLAHDWLEECTSCTGPVLIMDIRDSYFQENPFGITSDGQDPPTIEGLQVFEENPIQTTDHWLVEWPVRECKNLTFSPPMPMLCSGSTIGTRQAMLQYLDIMYEEMKKWISDPKCHFKNNGDDQSIHNYLFYNQQLPFAEAIPPRTGIVNTVGVDGANIHREAKKRKGVSYKVYGNVKANKGTWIGDVESLDYALTDDKGYFINHDGKRSRVIHQYDRFGKPLNIWLAKNIFNDV